MRDFRERESEEAWKVVHRRKNSSHHSQALRTCFINRLPASITIKEIAQTFRTHGAIANIVIPMNQKLSSQKFAFVQYHYPQSLHTAIRDEHGRDLNGSKITVYPAKHDTRTPSNQRHYKPSTKPSITSYHPKITKHPHKPMKTRDHRSYKEATKPSIP